jgi:hypothetical protein
VLLVVTKDWILHYQSQLETNSDILKLVFVAPHLASLASER